MSTLKEDLETRSWASFSDIERTCWLQLFVMNRDVSYIDGVYVLNDGTVIEEAPDPNLVYECEREIKNTEFESYYISACVTEISNYTYKGIDPLQVKEKSNATTYYRNSVYFPVERRAEALFWAMKKIDFRK